MALDLSTAQTHLDAWIAADLAIAGGAQSYTITTPNGSRSVSRTDAATIRDQIAHWQRVVNRLTAAAAGSGNPGVAIARWGDAS